MMQTFETAAIVSLIDHLSGPLSGLSGKVRDQSEGMMTRHQRIMQNMKVASVEAFKGIGIAAGVAAEHTVREMTRVGLETDRIMTKIVAFTHMDAAGRRAYERIANVDAAGYRGGPEEATKAELAGVRGGIGTDPDKIKTLMKWANVYGAESDRPLAEATSEILDHLQMAKELRNDKGQPITAAQATPAQLDSSLKEVIGRLAIIAQNSNQSMSQVYQMMKLAGPIANATHMDWKDLGVTASFLGQAGVKGEELGNTIKSGIARVLAPTNKARAALLEHGLKSDDFFQFDRDSMQPKNVLDAINSRTGNTNAATQAAVTSAINAFKGGGTGEALQNAITKALVGSGSKSFANRAAASNFSSDLLAGFVKQADFPGIVKALQGIPGALNEVFGKLQGGRLAAMTKDELAQWEDRRKAIEGAGEPKQMAEHANDIVTGSFSASWDRLVGRFEGMAVQLFNPWKEALSGAMDSVSGFLNAIAGGSEGARKLEGAAVAGAAALMVLATAAKAKSVLDAITGGGGGVAAAKAAGELVGGAVGAAGAATAAGTAAGFIGPVLPEAPAALTTGVAGAAATAAAGAGVVAAGVTAAVATGLTEALVKVGAIQPTIKPNAGDKGHWETIHEGRFVTKKWMADSLFERFDRERPDTKLFGRAWEPGHVFQAPEHPDDWYKPGRNEGSRYMPRVTLDEASIGRIKSMTHDQAMAQPAVGAPGWRPSDTPRPVMPLAPDLRQVKQEFHEAQHVDVSVSGTSTGTMTGEATVHLEGKVEAGSELLRVYTEMKSGIMKMSAAVSDALSANTNRLGQTMAGSNAAKASRISATPVASAGAATP